MKWVAICPSCRDPGPKGLGVPRAAPCFVCGGLTWWRHPRTPLLRRGWFFWLNVGLSALFGVGCAFLLTVIAVSLFWAWKQ